MTDTSTKSDRSNVLSTIKEFEAIKAKYKECKERLQTVLKDTGLCTFQDPETKAVYRIEVPTGTYVNFDPLTYVRTALPGEKAGSLSKKEAASLGYNV